MLMPSIFGENLFDNDWMSFPFEREFFGRRNPAYSKLEKNMMKTDVRETDNGYELDIDLPGYTKEDIGAQLENGYLTITAKKDSTNEKKDDQGRYIRQERYTGSMSRSFYVGDAVTQEEVKAKFENGILKLSVPKKDKEAIQQNKYIAIEG